MIPRSPTPKDLAGTGRIRFRTAFIAAALWCTPGFAPAAPHSLSISAAIETPVVREVCVSPRGRWVAFLVRRAAVSAGRYRDTIYVSSSDGAGTAVGLTAGRDISQLRWIPGRHAVSFLWGATGADQLWMVDVASRRTSLLIEHAVGSRRSVARGGITEIEAKPNAVGVLEYAWSPDGRHVAFTAVRPISAAEASSARRSGYVYDDTRLYAYRLYEAYGTENWLPEPVELWRFDIGSRKERRLLTIDGDIHSLQWAPLGARLAFAFTETPHAAGRGAGVLRAGVDVLDDVLRRGVARVRTVANAQEPFTWTHSGALAYVGDDQLRIVGAAGDELGAGRFADKATTFSILASKSTVYAVMARSMWSGMGIGLRRLDAATHQFVKLDTERHGTFPLGRPCAAASDADVVACIEATSVKPAEVVFFSIGTRGRTRTQIHAHPAWGRLAAVSYQRWQNRYGNWGDGFVVRPWGAVRGSPTPILCIPYGRGFYGDFLSQAEWMTPYPVQSFARAGFIVLLINTSALPLGKAPEPYRTPFQERAFREAYNPLATIEAAIDDAVARFGGDARRVGIMGVSYGGFLTNFAMTHSRRFEAASSYEGSMWDPSWYWDEGRADIRHHVEQFYGGPLSRKTFENIASFAPALNVSDVRTAYLEEASDHGGPDGLQLYEALRGAGVPVESVTYHADYHILSEPAHRFASMTRNLDWFRFWLLAQEDPAPSKSSQFARWRSMRAAQMRGAQP